MTPEKAFLQDVENHKIKVIRDDEDNRHIRFMRPDTSAYYFDLITWPGHLCYTGDMGTYVFQRSRDMFDFFRTGKEDWNYKPGGISINPGYWSEKIIATDKNSGHREWDDEEFVRRVNSVRVGWMREAKQQGTSKEYRRELWEDVESVVLSEPNNEMLCMTRIYEYSFPAGHLIGSRHVFSFTDFFDAPISRHTFNYTWCCYAIAWGITQYDKAKEAK